MIISENLSKVLKRYKRETGLTFQRLAQVLELPVSSTESYYNGTGNPRADTLEGIAQHINVPLEKIVSGPLPGQEQAETIIWAARELSSLPPERREKGLQLFRDMTDLFAGEDQT